VVGETHIIHANIAYLLGVIFTCDDDVEDMSRFVGRLGDTLRQVVVRQELGDLVVDLGAISRRIPITTEHKPDARI
jgi:hypothetical protein